MHNVSQAFMLAACASSTLTRVLYEGAQAPGVPANFVLQPLTHIQRPGVGCTTGV